MNAPSFLFHRLFFVFFFSVICIGFSKFSLHHEHTTHHHNRKAHRYTIFCFLTEWRCGCLCYLNTYEIVWLKKNKKFHQAFQLRNLTSKVLNSKQIQQQQQQRKIKIPLPAAACQNANTQIGVFAPRLYFMSK